MITPMGPPPPKPPSLPPSSESMKTEKEKKKSSDHSQKKTPVRYTPPKWGGPSGCRFFLEVLQHGAIVDQIDVSKRGSYMFGRDHCNFNLKHPTTSHRHAVLQFKIDGTAYIYDLGSDHGTFINKKKVKERVYVKLHVGDIIQFGLSTRRYIFQGPKVLMPLETDLERIRRGKYLRGKKYNMHELSHPKQDDSLTKGISWGMHEDAIEENEIKNDGITWQTYTGQLTEKQEMIRGEVLKRIENISLMKKEIDDIHAKDIAQGGLTQGQRTQIARNEQRTSQILEELENLEEILNGSIRESIGARTGRPNHEEDEGYLRDEDDFYDRTRKPNKPRSGENRNVETADSLLDKRNTIIKEMEEKEKALLQEKDDISEANEVPEAGDELDTYMSALSSQLVMERKDQIRKDLSALQSELDRILLLLKMADSTSEASKNRQNPEESKGNGQFADSRQNRVLKDHGLENTTSGSIIRKRERDEEYLESIGSDQSATGRDMKAEDAVPILLRHSTGLHASNEMAVEGQDGQSVKHPTKDKKGCGMVFGLEIPSFSVQIMKPGFLLKDNLEVDRPR